MSRFLICVRLLGWLAFLAAGHVTLRLLDSQLDHVLFDSFDVSDMAADPLVVPIAGLFLGATAALWYLTGTTALWILAGVVGWHPLTRLADAVTLPLVRRVVGTAIGISVVAVAGGPTVASASTSPNPPLLVHLGPAEPQPPVPAHAGPASSLPPTISSTAELGHPPGSPVRDTWVVEAGQNLWVIAEARLTDRLERSPEEGELLAYWQELKAANPELRNPDVIHAGQRLTLPL